MTYLRHGPISRSVAVEVEKTACAPMEAPSDPDRCPGGFVPRLHAKSPWLAAGMPAIGACTNPVAGQRGGTRILAPRTHPRMHRARSLGGHWPDHGREPAPAVGRVPACHRRHPDAGSTWFPARSSLRPLLDRPPLRCRCKEPRSLPKSSRKESGLQELAEGIHGQIPCQEHPVADDMENRWKLGHRVPTGFGVVGSDAKNGYAGIRVSPRGLEGHPPKCERAFRRMNA
jgi:hypothetical protein